MSNAKLEAALKYAGMGWCVVPLHTPMNGRCSCRNPECGKGTGKHPRIKGWEDAATTDEATIRQWWKQWPGANVGIAIGKSGMVALDIDPGNGGDVGALPLSLTERETITNLTGSGGEHLIYRKPNGVKISNSDKALTDGINVRGDGGLITVWPSLHYSGNIYEWEEGYSPFDIDPLPLPESLKPLLSINGASAESSLAKPKPAGPIADRLPAGKRNNELTSLGGTMRHRGMEEAEILTALLAVNQKRCDPPLDEKEVETIAKSIARYEPAGAPNRGNGTQPDTQAPVTTEIRNTDLGNAMRLVARHGDSVRYCYNWGKWLVWDGKRWAIDDTGETFRRAKDTVRGIYAEAAQAITESERKTLASWAIRSEAKARIDAMLSLAESEPGIPVIPDDLDANPMALNVANGTIDLREGTLYTHEARRLITKLAPVDFDPSATCPLWITFLDRIMNGNEELIQFLQRAIGWALTSDTTEQVFFILHGTGANGKSTLLQAISTLLGDYAQQTPTETLLIKRSGSIPNDVARLKGTRLVTAIEAEEGRRMAESLIKQMTGGDKVTARFLHQEWFEFEPTFKIWLATNHKPIIKGTDHAIWRRIRLIPFNITIPEQEQDKALLEKLKGELPGILAWAVEGCLEWQKHGLGIPDAVKMATETYRNEMDVIGQFLDDCTYEPNSEKTAPEDANTVRTKAGELYKAYVEWCKDNSESPVTRTKFGRRLVERGYEKTDPRETKYVYYLRLGLLT